MKEHANQHSCVAQTVYVFFLRDLEQQFSSMKQEQAAPDFVCAHNAC